MKPSLQSGSISSYFNSPDWDLKKYNFVWMTKGRTHFLDYVPYTEGSKLLCMHTQLRPPLWDPLDYSPPYPSVHGIFQASWSGLPCPPPGDFPDPEIKPTSLVSPALTGRFFTQTPPGVSLCVGMCVCACMHMWWAVSDSFATTWIITHQSPLSRQEY